MANIKSQKKRVITNEKSRKRNVAIKSSIKTQVNKVIDFVNKKDKQSAYDALIIANQKYDKSVSQGVYKKKTVGNKKSKLTKLVNGLEGNVKKTVVTKKAAPKKKLAKTSAAKKPVAKKTTKKTSAAKKPSTKKV